MDMKKVNCGTKPRKDDLMQFLILLSVSFAIFVLSSMACFVMSVVKMEENSTFSPPFFGWLAGAALFFLASVVTVGVFIGSIFELTKIS